MVNNKIYVYMKKGEEIRPINVLLEKVQKQLRWVML